MRSRAAAALDLLPFIALAEMRTWGPTLEVEATYHGLLDQWVVEHYEWGLKHQLAGDPERPWRLYRIEINPRLEGASAIDQWFGKRPPFHPEFVPPGPA